MILLQRRYKCIIKIIAQPDVAVNVKHGKGLEMALTRKGWAIIIIIAAAAFVLGRLAARAFMNLLLGGTLFGGNFL